VLRCLEKDLARRFHSLGELARALRPFAPPRAIVSVERISLLLGGLDELATTEPAPTRPSHDQPALAAPTAPMLAGGGITEGAVASTLPRRRSRLSVAFVAAIAAGCTAIAALFVVAFHGGDTRAPASDPSPTAVVMESVPTVEPPAPTGQATGTPAPELSASPPTPALVSGLPATSASAPPSKAPQKTTQPKPPPRNSQTARPIGDQY